MIVNKKSTHQRYTFKAFFTGAVGGAINKIANFLLVIALLHLSASLQYPMVTGGVIIVSTLIAFLGKRKPSKRELLSVFAAFVGMLALLLIDA